MIGTDIGGTRFFFRLQEVVSKREMKCVACVIARLYPIMMSLWGQTKNLASESPIYAPQSAQIDTILRFQPSN